MAPNNEGALAPLGAGPNREGVALGGAPNREGVVLGPSSVPAELGAPKSEGVAGAAPDEEDGPPNENEKAPPLAAVDGAAGVPNKPARNFVIPHKRDD